MITVIGGNSVSIKSVICFISINVLHCRVKMAIMIMLMWKAHHNTVSTSYYFFFVVFQYLVFFNSSEKKGDTREREKSLFFDLI